MGSENSKCPNCSGILEYRADYRKFGCKSCQSFFTDEQIRIMFKGKNRPGVSHQSSTDERTEEFCRGSLYRCTECGAEIVTAFGKKTEHCFFCGGTPEKQNELPADYIPEGIVPFEITREKAAEIITENTASYRFRPSDLIPREGLADKLSGIYIPLWMADCSVSVRMNGTGKSVKRWTHGAYSYTETKEFAAERKGDAEYFSVPSDATGKLSGELKYFLGDYNFSRLRKFEPSDLLTHPAEYSSADTGEAFRYIRTKVTDSVRSALEKSVSGYSEFSVQNENIDILGAEWNCALVPVWFLTYNHCGRTVRFIVNGQNGKFVGKVPLSVKKLAVSGVLAAFGITAVYRLAELITGFAGPASESGYFFRSTGIGIAAGIAAAAVLCFIVSRKYKPSFEAETDTCAGDGETSFTTKLDRYVRQYTTKVKAENPENS